MEKPGTGEANSEVGALENFQYGWGQKLVQAFYDASRVVCVNADKVLTIQIGTICCQTISCRTLSCTSVTVVRLSGAPTYGQASSNIFRHILKGV